MNKTAPKKPELQLQGALDLSPSPESCPVTFRERYGHFIDGKRVAGKDADDFDTLNPATGQPIARVAAADATEVDKAVKAARKAYDKVWSKMSPADRGKYIYRIARRLQERSRELAVAETIDNGKPIRETMAADVPLAIDHFRYFAGALRAQEGGISQIDNDTVAYHFHEPLGVVGQIIPWNFPLLMACCT